MKGFVIVALSIGISASSALAQDVTAGETSFRKCAPCHSVGDGAANKVGPELNGLDGRKAGVVEGFNYSDANKSSSYLKLGTFKNTSRSARGARHQDGFCWHERQEPTIYGLSHNSPLTVKRSKACPDVAQPLSIENPRIESTAVLRRP